MPILGPRGGHLPWRRPCIPKCAPDRLPGYIYIYIYTKECNKRNRISKRNAPQHV